MRPPPEPQAIEEVARRLGELLQAPAEALVSERSASSFRYDAVIHVGERVFLVEWKSSGDVAGVTAGVRALTSRHNLAPTNMVILLAVPYMGEAGRRICGEHRVSWLDLSGNAHVDAPGVHVHVEGKENRFKRRGRPSNPFAPKSARVARWLLVHPEKFHVQQEMAAAIGVGAGFVSRIVRRLEELDLIERNDQGAVRARNPKLLLEAWAERYEFDQHHVLRGHVAARSGEELAARISAACDGAGIEHAATGLAGAWLLTHFAAFRAATFYVAKLPPSAALADIGFHEDERGANAWLALPKDEGVFLGAEKREGIPCAHPVQVWLDLKHQPERAAQASCQLEETLLAGLGRAVTPHAPDGASLEEGGLPPSQESA